MAAGTAASDRIDDHSSRAHIGLFKKCTTIVHSRKKTIFINKGLFKKLIV